MDELTPRRRQRGGAAVAAPATAELRLVQKATTAGVVARFMFGFFVVLCLAVLAWPTLPRRYESTATIVLRPTDREGQSDSVQSMRQPLDENAIQSEVDMIGATSVIDTVLAKHGIAADPEFTAPSLIGRVKAWIRPGEGAVVLDDSALRRRIRAHMVVGRDRKSYTVRVGFWSSDPAKAFEVARTFLSAYLDDQISRKRKAAEMLFGWLEQRAEVMRTKQDASARAVSEFVTQSGLIDRGAQISLDAQLTALSTEAAQARARAIDASTRSAMLASMQKSGTLDGAPEVLASTTIQALKQNLTAALGRTVVMSPEFKSVTDQIAAESDRIVRSAEAEARNWIRREAALQEQIKAIRGMMIVRQQAEMKLERLQQEAANDRTVLAEALTRMKGQAAGEGAQRADVEVISAPETPAEPSFPSLPLYAIGSLLAACLAGLALNWRPLLARSRRVLAA